MLFGVSHTNHIISFGLEWFVTQRNLASPLSSQSPCRITNMVLQLQEALPAIILLSCCAERRAIRSVCRDTLRIGNDMAIYFSTFLTCNEHSTRSRALFMAFYNNCLKLPSGLEFVDDLDSKPNGWNN